MKWEKSEITPVYIYNTTRMVFFAIIVIYENNRRKQKSYTFDSRLIWVDLIAVAYILYADRWRILYIHP